MNRKTSLSLLLTTICAVLLCQNVLAQVTSARLEGYVKDPTDAIVPGVTVVATNEGKNMPYEALSNEQGLYVFPKLPPGNYTITAELTGFKKFLTKGIHLELGDTKSLNVKLETGQMTETVTVDAQTTTIDTVSTQIGKVVNTKQLQDLPLSTRDPMQLFYLQPGANRFTGGGRADGLRGLANNVTVEGISATEAALGSGATSTAAPVPLDAVGEYRVVTSSASAEYGRGGGTQVQLIYKSGTNEFHGSASDFHRNKVLNANSFSNNRTIPRVERPTFIRNQFGGTVGGPIIRGKAFFNFTYEGIRQKTTGNPNRLVYTDTVKKDGIFRYNNTGAANSITMVDRNGIPTIPATSISTINLLTVDPTRTGKDSSGLFDKNIGFMPSPNNFDTGDGFNTAGFRYQSVNPFIQNQWVLKGDYQLTRNHRLGLTGAHQAYTSYSSVQLNGYRQINAEPYPTSILSLDSTLTTHWLNEFRTGTIMRGANFTNTDPDRYKKEGVVVFVGLGGPGRDHPKDVFLPQLFPTFTWTVADNMTWIKGNHSFKAGVDIRIHRSNVFFGGDDYFPIIDTRDSSNPATLGTQAGLASADRSRAQQIVNDLTGSLGRIDEAYHANSRTAYTPFETKYRAWRGREYSFFFQDTWKVKERLTLNLGTRYEIIPSIFEANGLFAYPVNGVKGLFGGNGETKLGLAEDGGAHIFGTGYHNFAPNVGFNWDPTGKGKWSVSGNYRIAYDRTWIATSLFQDFNQEGMSTYPILDAASGSRLSSLPSRFNATTGYFNPGAIFSPKPYNRQGLVTVYDPDWYVPYTGAWSLRLQREITRNTLLVVSYVGNKATGSPRAIDLNQLQIRSNGFLTGFLAAQANLAANGNPLTGQDTGGFGSLYRVMTTADQNSQRTNISQGNVWSVANFMDQTRASSNYLQAAGLPLSFFRQNPQFDSVYLLGNISNSTWNGMKLEVTRRFSGGLQFDVNYTLSKGLTDYEGGQSQRSPYRDIADGKLEKSYASIDARHVINGNFIWSVPVGKNQRWFNGANTLVNGFIGGWQINGIYAFSTGSPNTITSNRNHLSAVASTANCSSCDPGMTSKVIKGDTIRALTTDEVKLFTDPVAGSAGQTALRYFRGSTNWIFDSSVFKSFPMKFVPGELGEIQFRLDWVNAFNHTNFGNPTFNITSGNFGIIGPPTGGQRIIQGALRFLF